MGRLLIAVMVLALTAAMCGVGYAQQSPAERYAGAIQNYKDTAAGVQGALGNMLGVAGEFPELSKEDVKLITAYMEEEIAAWNGAAAALEKGDEKGAEALAKKAQAMDNKRDIWPQRLSWRRGQAQLEYLPATQDSYDVMVGDRKADEVAEIGAFIEAKKLRSEAYGRLADAALPGTDPQVLAKLEDEVFAADVEVQVANIKVSWANEDRGVRLWLATDLTVSSPQYTAAKERLAEWRKKYEEAYRTSREKEHALEVQKRQYKEIYEARSTAYKVAKAAKDAAKKAEK